MEVIYQIIQIIPVLCIIKGEKKNTINITLKCLRRVHIIENKEKKVLLIAELLDYISVKNYFQDYLKSDTYQWFIQLFINQSLPSERI